MEPLLAPEGDVLVEHRATYTNRVLAVLFLVGPGVLLTAMAMQLQGTDLDARPPMLVTAAVLVALGVLGFFQQNKVKAVLRSDGVERWGLRGKLWSLRWSDAAELRYRVVKIRIYHVIPAGTYIYLSLADASGRKRKLPANLKGIELLSERIIEKQTDARLPEARKRIEDGEEVSFGKALRLDKEKLSTRKLFGGLKSCPLAEIEKVSIEAGALRVRQKGKMFAFASFMVGSVPNVFLLLRLLGNAPPSQQNPKASVA
jgi:hypothetical protein